MLFFSKMQATGNDFIIVDAIENEFRYDINIISKYMCDRHIGIGADGVIFLYRSEISDFKMRIINQDGTEAEMCGNGIRCLAKYIYQKYLNKNKKNMTIETLAGIKEIEILEAGKIKVNMGEPIFCYKEIPVFYENNRSINIKIDSEIYELFPISMGNPHAVCFKNDIENIDLEKIGKILEGYKYFPSKTNVEFVQIIDNENIRVRVWERGVGETLSCGTGASAAGVISNLKKSTNNELKVELLGGNLEIIFNKNVFLIGDAKKVFEGKIEFEEI